MVVGDNLIPVQGPARWPCFDRAWRQITK